jgi:cytoskeletal protein CcmA (bactofilin family)
MGIFGRKARRAREPGSVPPPRHQPGDAGPDTGSMLGPDVLIAGNVGAADGLRIDGRVEGDVTCKTLTQGAGSEIVGRVTADTARLGGATEGAVRVRLLIVERSARIIGDIEYENIMIEDGGHIDGRLKHMSLAEPLAVAVADGEAGAYLSRAGSSRE